MDKTKDDINKKTYPQKMKKQKRQQKRKTTLLFLSVITLPMICINLRGIIRNISQENEKGKK